MSERGVVVDLLAYRTTSKSCVTVAQDFLKSMSVASQPTAQPDAKREEYRSILNRLAELTTLIEQEEQKLYDLD